MRLKAIGVALFAVSMAGCSVSPPGRLETSLAVQVKRRLTVSGKKDRNPLPSDAETIHSGLRAFSHYCVSCHGLDGQNTGVPFAAAMSPPVPDLNSSQVQAYSDGQLHWIIRNGLYPSGMPASKDMLNDEEIWSIVTYLRHLPPKGSLGEPKFYSEEMPLPKYP